MKLFNAIAIYDIYVVAESSEDARKALLAAIAAGSQPPSEIVGFEVTREAAIRTSWIDERPFVGEEVSEQALTEIKGKSTAEIFRQLYTKQPK